MRLIIFGSTGSVGRLVVAQALAQGHTVTAFARNPAVLQDLPPARLTIHQGDALNPASVEQAVKGHDAVVCALGAGRKGTVRSEGTKNIIRAMEKTGTKRLVCQTTLGAGDSRGNLNFFWKYIMFGFLLKEAMKDHELQEKYVRQSNLDWTIVRPAAFTDGAATGNYRHGFSGDAKSLTLKISRADVAGFLLTQLTTDEYMKKTPGLSY
ncbi:NAD(P)-dependent oxidoreductase [Larkinella insperata]|uniref:NAD(P)-dependent oxidoreductase n=1 Tax=Larkinella insperata TaxID=332158 RepID=A0ABW3QA60_9BACT|nr:SDR family oxidoreductase [Larkinella insperata]